jgi:hypothetical protein
MTRPVGADDVVIIDHDNGRVITVINDEKVFEVDANGIVVPGNLIVSGSISPISGTFANFHVTSNLHVSGAIDNPVGSLILSASNSSVVISSSLQSMENIGASGSVIAASGSIDRISTTVVSASNVAVSGRLDVVGNLTGSTTIFAATGSFNRGIRHAYQFYVIGFNAGATQMTSSQLSTSVGTFAFVDMPLFAPKGGSVLGYALSTANGETIDAGAITSSITVGGNTGSLKTAWDSSTGGSQGDYDFKSTMAYLNGWSLGVSLTASADYKTSGVAGVSASLIVNVIVED